MNKFLSILLILFSVSQLFAASDCDADFNWELSGLSASFTDDSNSDLGEIISWYYTVDGEFVSDDPDFEFTFPDYGLYEVCLVIETSGGCTDDRCRDVLVTDAGADCFVAFTYFVDGSIVDFNAETDPETYSSILWSFGDGTSSDGIAPEHTYSDDGVYEVCVTVIFPDSCVATACDVVVIGTGGGDCAASLEVWTVDGLEIQFFGSVTPDFDEVTYTFTYGDGTSETFSGTGSGADPWHAYDEAGTYEVCLSIETGTGCTDETCIEIFIGDSTGTDCTASFDYELDGTTVYFNSTTDPGPGDVVSYLWSFGDGSSGDGADPDHIYEPGEYLVCLTVTFASGCVAEYCSEIFIADSGDACNAYFNITSITPDGDGWVVHFNNESTVTGGDIGTVLWNFGDGTSADSYDAEHYFTISDIYTVCVTITDADGTCEDTYCLSVILGIPDSTGECEASFEYELSGGFGSFFSTSDAAGDIVAYAWDFGDGDYATGEDVEHTFDEGIYEVCLTIFTIDSCVSTYCETLVIGDSTDMCAAYFVVSSMTETGDGWVVEFNNESSGTYTGNAWVFGDGGSSDGVNPEHIYTTSGFYTVCLTIGESGTDCYDQYCTDIYVGECIDESLIDTLFSCTEEYEPVCGCDGVTYSNECYATYYGGVLSWTEGECGATGIEEELIMGAVMIIPNPASGIFTTEFNLGKSQWMQITLMDMRGRIAQTLFTGVMQSGINRIQADAGMLPSGLCFLQINDGETVRTEKVMIAK